MSAEKDFIKEEFQRILEARQLSEESCPGAEYCDWCDILQILRRNYEDTVAFLETATQQEIACAVDVLEDLVKELPKEKAQQIIGIFEKKLDQFPCVQEVSATEYALELKIAREILEEKEM